MPIVSIKFRPGIEIEATPAANEGGWSDSDQMRFKDGLWPQKLGGWTTLLSGASGTIRALHAWQAIDGTSYLAIGTTTKLYVWNGTSLQDVTPYSSTNNITPGFTTTLGSSQVQVHDPGSNANLGDLIAFSTPIYIAGGTISGMCQVVAVADVNNYTIELQNGAVFGASATGGTLASFTTNAGSNVVTISAPNIAVFYPVGTTTTFGVAVAVGGVTISGYHLVESTSGTDHLNITLGSTLASSTATVVQNGGMAQLIHYSQYLPTGQPAQTLTTTNWTLDNWGDILMATPAFVGWPLTWSPDLPSGSLAFPINQAPAGVAGGFVAMPEQIFVCYGREGRLVEWSTVSDYTVWQPLASNQAGSYVIPNGSKIVRCMQGPQQFFIWTDIELWVAQYTGYPFVFGFNKIGTNCGLVGPNAVTMVNGVPLWMSRNRFMTIGGSGVPVEAPCSVWDCVFQDIDTANLTKVVIGTNSDFNEVWCFYPVAGGSGEPSAYAKVHTPSGMWDRGSVGRTAWTDQSVFGPAMGSDTTGKVYQHETSPDADGVAMTPFIESGWYMLDEGDSEILIDQIWPDAKWGAYGGSQNAQVQMTLTAQDAPTAPVQAQSMGPFTLNQTTPLISTQIKGRMIKVRFASADLGSFWRLGNMRVRLSKLGRGGGV